MRKIKIGIVGLGGLGKIHAYNLAFKIPNAQLVAVCSRTEEKLQYAKEELQVGQTYQDYDEMLQKGDIEAVVIVSPSKIHSEHIRKAMKAGKHVFCEKPLGITEEECEATAAVAKKCNSRIITLGFMRRFECSNVYAKKRIEAGDIGIPYLVKTVTIDPAADVNNCIAFARSNRGMLYPGLGVHDTDMLHWLLGDRAVSVYAIGGSYKNKEFAEIGDTEVSCALYRFKNGGMGIQHVGRAAPHGYHIETEIVGTDGTIRISPVPQKNLAFLLNENGMVMDCIKNYKERFADAFLEEMTDFVNCVETGCRPRVTVEDGVIATKMALAAARSLERNEIEELKW